MIALASVDLPEPFGPIRAWISPRATVEVDPLEDLLVLGGHVQVLDLELSHSTPFVAVAVCGGAQAAPAATVLGFRRRGSANSTSSASVVRASAW